MKITDFELLDDGVQYDIQEYVTKNNLATEDTFQSWVEQATPCDILNAYLCWNGIIGWTDTIMSIAEVLFQQDENG